MNLSKKHQLQNYVRIFSILIGVSALLWNCEKEEIIEPTETIEIQEEPKINVKMVTLEHLQQKEVLNDRLKSIVTALDISKNNLDGNKNNYAQSRISSTDNSFVILTDDILEVTTDSTETYTFRIETPTDATSTFENFVIEKVDDTYLFSITKLVKIEDSKDDFPYTMTRQSISEEQINLEDFEDILKPIMYYDYASGCYWYTYSSSALARNDSWAIFWCPEAGGGGPGGDGDPNDTGNSTDTHDYDSNQDPDDNSDSGSGQGGGGTGTTNTTDPIINPNSPIGVLPARIEDELTGKAKCIYDKLNSSGTGFADAINKFDGNFPVSHLTFIINNTLPNGNYGITNPPDNYNITIEFSNTQLENISDIGGAVAIAHEVIHAEIFRKMLSAAQKGDLNLGQYTTLERTNFVNSLRNNFPGLYDYYWQRYKTTWNHNLMAQHYRTTIADIVQEFDSSSLSRQTYEDISWVGLRVLEDMNNSVAWDNLNSDEQSRISTNITNFFINGN